MYDVSISSIKKLLKKTQIGENNFFIKLNLSLKFKKILKYLILSNRHTVAFTLLHQFRLLDIKAVEKT